MRRPILAAAIALGGFGAYRLLASGAATIDIGIGRRVRRLGPVSWDIAADREVVFDVIADPYLGRTPRALGDKLAVWERGTDMVLAPTSRRSRAASLRQWKQSASSDRAVSTSASCVARSRTLWNRSSLTR
jgi:hypothetical protein